MFSSPLLICACFFLIDDPFGVLYKNECLAETSEDVMETREYLKNWQTKKYSSFIFGNSRANAFNPEVWKKYIGGEVIFKFNCPGESVLNIKKKLDLILAKQPIKNALILIDDGILENTNNQHRFYQGPVYNHSPITSNISYINFYGNYVKYYFNNFFFLKHIYFKLTHTYKANWMNNAFKNPEPIKNIVKPLNYESMQDSLIETNFLLYKQIFKPDYSFFKKKIKSISVEDSLHLIEIKKLLEDNGVNYKIIIPPDFSKLKEEQAVYTTLKSIFSNKLYDFTGVNKITLDSTLNYENLHFTKKAGAILLDSIYN